MAGGKATITCVDSSPGELVPELPYDDDEMRSRQPQPPPPPQRHTYIHAHTHPLKIEGDLPELPNLA